MPRSHGGGRPSERGIIAAIEAGLGGQPAGGGGNPHVRIGLGDDAAVLRLGAPGGRRGLTPVDTVVTTDLLIEGIHFDLRYMSLADAAYKALAVNLSDVAAMGARPSFALGQLGVPHRASQSDVDQVLAGVAAAQQASAVAGSPLQLIGGDTVAAPQWVLGFTVLGELQGPPLTRSGARPGDGIWISGSPGLSQTGLHLLWGSVSGGRQSRPAAKDFPAACSAQRRPQAQIELGLWLQRKGLATACLDLSDSLSQSLLLLARASEVGLHTDLSGIELDRDVLAFTSWLAGRRRGAGENRASLNLPAALDPAGRARGYDSLAGWLLASAEDYGLLFTAPDATSRRLRRDSPARLQRIGTVVEAVKGCHYQLPDGQLRPLERTGFEHL